MNLAPIVLFAYNRPRHLQQTLEALRAAHGASNSQLWVFCDGAKDSAMREKVEEVRDVAHGITGFSRVTLIERQENLGLAASVCQGVTQLCQEYGRVIVVEDDLMVAPSFLEFMNLALDRYQDHDRVMQVSGYMYPGTFGVPTSALFLPMISCWGWGTWHRAWKDYDASMAGLHKLEQDRTLKNEFDLGGAYGYYDMAKRQFAGEIDSWGICWNLTVFMQKGLVLYPNRTLVRNVGVDGSGTHGGGSPSLQEPLSHEDRSGGFYFPNVVETDAATLGQIADYLKTLRKGFWARMFQRIVT